MAGNTTWERLPGAVRAKVDELRASLVAALGQDLVALLAHGSAARGEYKDGKSDVDLVIVVREAARDKLDAIANPLNLARYSARVETMILTADEIPHACDVFPLLYDDIRRAHVVLHGESPFDGLVISDKHRRLRVEQELREAQIRLRRSVTDAQGSQEMVGGAVARKLKQIRSPLHALLGLRGIEVTDDLRAVVERAGTTYRVDVADLFDVHERPARAYEAMEKLLAAAVVDVDGMDTDAGRAT
jgi:predicted nucleotidyltransferase